MGVRELRYIHAIEAHSPAWAHALHAYLRWSRALVHYSNVIAFRHFPYTGDQDAPGAHDEELLRYRLRQALSHDVVQAREAEFLAALPELQESLRVQPEPEFFRQALATNNADSHLASLEAILDETSLTKMLNKLDLMSPFPFRHELIDIIGFLAPRFGDLFLEKLLNVRRGMQRYDSRCATLALSLAPVASLLVELRKRSGTSKPKATFQAWHSLLFYYRACPALYEEFYALAKQSEDQDVVAQLAGFPEEPPKTNPVWAYPAPTCPFATYVRVHGSTE